MVTSLVALFALMGQQSGPLTPGPVIAVPSPGAFSTIVFDAKYHRVLAAHTEAAQLAVLDVATGKVQEIETGGLHSVIVDEAVGKVFATGSNQKLLGFDRETLKKTDEIDLGIKGDAISLDAKRGRLILTEDEGDDVWYYNASTLKGEGKTGIESESEGVAVDGDRYYAAITETSEIRVINAESKAVVGTWKTAPAVNPRSILFDPATRRAFVHAPNGKLNIFDLRAGKLLTTVEVPLGVGQIGFDAERKTIYVACHGAIAVLKETETGATLVAKVKAPASVRSLAVDPTTHTVWIAYGNANSANFQSFTAK